MPCKTAEERQLRDRKAFLLHSLFVDVSVFRAVAAIKHLIDNNQQSASSSGLSILHEERVGDLLISVTKDPPDGSTKLDSKNDGSKVLGVTQEEVTKRNLLKGITADENATVHVCLGNYNYFFFYSPALCEVINSYDEIIGPCRILLL